MLFIFFTWIYFQDCTHPHAKSQRAGVLVFSELICGPLRALNVVSFGQVIQELAEILYQTAVVWNIKQNVCAAKQTRGLNKQNKPIVSPYKQQMEDGEGWSRIHLVPGP